MASPEAHAGASVDFKHYVDIAQTAERGKFDMIFLAETSACEGRSSAVASRRTSADFEPITLLSALVASPTASG